VTGHSSGEIAAAYAIGALNLEDAMRVAYFRGVASTNLADKGLVRGSMMAVGLSKKEALPYLAGLSKGKAVIACTNSLSSLTISGDEAAIDELHSILEEERIFARKLVGKRCLNVVSYCLSYSLTSSNVEKCFPIHLYLSPKLLQLSINKIQC